MFSRYRSMAASILMGSLLLGGTNAYAVGKRGIVAACTTTLHEYAQRRDQLDAEGYANLFTEDGVFVFKGQAFTGRKAIAKRLEASDKTLTTRHLVGSIVITPNQQGPITARSYVQVYQAKTSDQEGPVAVEKTIFAEYHDTLKMQDKRCLIQRRETHIVFFSP